MPEKTYLNIRAHTRINAFHAVVYKTQHTLADFVYIADPPCFTFSDDGVFLLEI